ncbi:MAG: hypothetical protein ACOYES_04955 [Bacillota bacterium]|jgi:hypothetical protein
MNWRPTLRLCLAVTLAIAGAGCALKPPAALGSGSMVVAAAIKSVPSASSVPELIVLTLSMGGFSLRHEMPVDGGAAHGAVQSLAAGNWLIDAVAMDGEGDAIYAGRAKAQVKRDGVTPVSITLRAVEGRVRIQVSAAGIADTPVHSADISVYYASGSSAYRYYKDIREQDGYFTVEDNGYPPRSYDFRVVLKAADGSVLYESEYAGFGVCPGKFTSVNWSPGLGDIQVDVEFLMAPGAPGNVCAGVDGTQAAVSWTAPPDGLAASYRVYWRYSLFDRYTTSRSQQVEAPATSALVSLSSQQRGSTVHFVVVARDSSGQESLRSSEIAVEYR